MAKLLDRVRDRVRVLHYSIRTEDAYVDWIRRFILFHGKRHPQEMGAPELETFLTHLAVDRNVAASTQNQALGHPVPLSPSPGPADRRFGQIIPARRPERLPTVLTRDEVRSVLAQLDGTTWLMASLLYGSGLRLLECLRLRIKDVDFGQRHIIIRDGKGQKDRVTLLPRTAEGPLNRQIDRVRDLHQRDLDEGFGRVFLPHALAEKYPRRSSVRLAISLSRRPPVHRSSLRHRPTSPCLRTSLAACRRRGRARRPDPQARQLPHVAP